MPDMNALSTMMLPRFTTQPPASSALPPVTPAPAPLDTREAMEILDRARQTPEYLRTHAVATAAQRTYDLLSTQKVDVKAEVGRAQSQFGLFALCLPIFGSMIALSKSGLTGGGAIAGLVIGFIGVPALAFYLVNRYGKSRAAEKQAELDQQKSVAQSQLTAANQQMQQAEAKELARLWNERAQHGARAVGTIEQSEETVKLGNVVVPKSRTAI